MKKVNSLLYACIAVFIAFLSVSTETFAHFGSKGPFGGTVTCAIKDGNNTVYLGTSAGGVFESTTSALVAWRARPVGLKSGKITALAHTGSYLFAATADSGVFIFTGFIGTDRYWKKVNAGLTNLKVTSLVAIDSITVLAGTTGGGIFKTTNKGATWTAANSGVHHFDITAFAKAGNRIIHTSDGGVWASDDKGATWMGFNNATVEHVAASEVSYNVTTNEIIISNTNGLYLAAAAATTTATPSYSLVQTGLPSNTLVSDISNNGTAWYLASNKGVFISATGTISWAGANTGLPTIAVTAIIPFLTDLVAGTDKEGVFKSPATSVSWVANNTSFNNLVTYSMVTSGVNLVVAATEKGVFVSKDLATTYVRSNTGLTDSLNVTDLEILGTKLYATTKNAGVFSTADSGKTWTPFNTGLTGVSCKKVIASASDLYVLALNGNVYEYNTTMSMWMPMQTGLPAGVVPTALAFYSNKLLLSTYGHGVYTKAKSASTWTASNAGLTNMNVTSVTAAGSKIFLGTDGAGVLVSDTATIGWMATSATSIPHTVTMGLDGTKIQAMAFYAGYVFASYKGGLLATSDNGTTWIAGGNQFNLPSYTDVNKISFVTTRVFVTTGNNSLYSNGLSELPTGTDDLPGSGSESYIVSPNPSRGEFVIKTSERSSREFFVYDGAGKLIRKFNSSAETITLDLNGYPKGIYFLKSSDGSILTINRLVIQ